MARARVMCGNERRDKENPGQEAQDGEEKKARVRTESGRWGDVLGQVRWLYHTFYLGKE